MNKGDLCRYSLESESEEAQLIVHNGEKERSLIDHHGTPTVEFYGTEGTPVSANICYSTGICRYITKYIKNCQVLCR